MRAKKLSVPASPFVEELPSVPQAEQVSGVFFYGGIINIYTGFLTGACF